MHGLKLLGQQLMARDFDQQLAELQVRIAVQNGYTALGIPITESEGLVRPGNGKLGHNLICPTEPNKVSSVAKKLPSCWLSRIDRFLVSFS